MEGSEIPTQSPGKIVLSKGRVYQAIIILLGILLVGSIALNLNLFAKSDKQVGSETKSFFDTVTKSDNTLDSSVKVSEGIYKVKISNEQGSAEVYVVPSMDMMFLGAGAINMTQIKEQIANSSGATTSQGGSTTKVTNFTCADFDKQAKPELYAFIVSRCPYGLQMQRVLSGLPTDLKNMVKIKYIVEVNNGKLESMHGDVEAAENLLQICLREEQSTKYWPYVNCYMTSADSTACLATAQVDTAKLSKCINSTGIDYAKADAALAAQLKIGSSPTLVFNGHSVSIDEETFFAQNSGANMRSVEAMKQMICCNMANQTSSCSKTFSTGYTASGLAPSTSSNTTTAASGSNGGIACNTG